jgi:hypothetical protein
VELPSVSDIVFTAKAMKQTLYIKITTSEVLAHTPNFVCMYMYVFTYYKFLNFKWSVYSDVRTIFLIFFILWMQCFLKNNVELF